jgi:hypothetical protein
MNLAFRKEEGLEKHVDTSAARCLQTFIQKSGTLQTISNLAKNPHSHFTIYPGDAVYPICSGGWCRSQVLWALLQPIAKNITLFPPHAARVGWDPYNGTINRRLNVAAEQLTDSFSAHFVIERAVRFGFENSSQWQAIEQAPTKEGIDTISQFYNNHYFGTNDQAMRRVYIAFSHNTHVTLYRLNQANDSLKNVTVIAIDLEDFVTYPPSFLNTTPGSKEAYSYLSSLLQPLIQWK